MGKKKRVTTQSVTATDLGRLPMSTISSAEARKEFLHGETQTPNSLGSPTSMASVGSMAVFGNPPYFASTSTPGGIADTSPSIQVASDQAKATSTLRTDEQVADEDEKRIAVETVAGLLDRYLRPLSVPFRDKPIYTVVVLTTCFIGSLLVMDNWKGNLNTSEGLIWFLIKSGLVISLGSVLVFITALAVETLSVWSRVCTVLLALVVSIAAGIGTAFGWNYVREKELANGELPNTSTKIKEPSETKDNSP